MFGIELRFLSRSAINLVTTVSEIFRIYYSEGTFKVWFKTKNFLYKRHVVAALSDIFYKVKSVQSNQFKKISLT
jgi:hypothetical protein